MVQESAETTISIVPTKEVENKRTTIDVVNFSELSGEDVDEVRQSVRRERVGFTEFAQGKNPELPEVKERANALLALTMSGYNSIIKRGERPGFLVKARNGNGELVGFGTVIIFPERQDPERAQLFFSRAYDLPHQGIAGELLKEEVRLLRSSGIKTYIARVGTRSEEVYRRSGLQTEEISKDEFGTAKLLVTL